MKRRNQARHDLPGAAAGEPADHRPKTYRAALLFALVLAAAFFTRCKTDPDDAVRVTLAGGTELRSRVVAKDLFVPWELVWGPDGWIWFTERNGTVKKVHPETGKTVHLLDIEDNYEWTSSGTLGLLLRGNPETGIHAYVVYTYNDDPDNPSWTFERCVRYTYDAQRERLVDPHPVIDSIFCGASGTFGARLREAPDGTLFLSTGCIPPGAGMDTLNGGPILRLNFDGSIPDDNPFAGRAVYSYGHRNPQGLEFGPGGILYASEHGPSSDDELNIIEAGRNYGWPDVWGPCDKSMETDYCRERRTVEPIYAWTPTIAPCGLVYYDHDAIPEWRNSLLLGTLKEKDLRVLRLDATGRKVISEDILFDNAFGRIRDICVAPDGRVFLSTSIFEREVADLNVTPRETAYDKIIEIAPAGKAR